MCQFELNLQETACSFIQAEMSVHFQGQIFDKIWQSICKLIFDIHFMHHTWRHCNWQRKGWDFVKDVTLLGYNIRSICYWNVQYLLGYNIRSICYWNVQYFLETKERFIGPMVSSSDTFSSWANYGVLFCIFVMNFCRVCIWLFLGHSKQIWHLYSKRFPEFGDV